MKTQKKTVDQVAAALASQTLSRLEAADNQPAPKKAARKAAKCAKKARKQAKKITAREPAFKPLLNGHRMAAIKEMRDSWRPLSGDHEALWAARSIVREAYMTCQSSEGSMRLWRVLNYLVDSRPASLTIEGVVFYGGEPTNKWAALGSSMGVN